MKKAWTIIILFVFAVGFFMGRAILGPKEVPDIPDTRQVAAYAAATPSPLVLATPTPTAAPTIPPMARSTSVIQTVYISRSNLIHSDPHCSGMKYYTEMPLDEAQSNGYRKCSKCW